MPVWIPFRGERSSSDEKNGISWPVSGACTDLQLCGIADSFFFWHSGRQTGTYEYCGDSDAVPCGDQRRPRHFGSAHSAGRNAVWKSVQYLIQSGGRTFEFFLYGTAETDRKIWSDCHQRYRRDYAQSGADSDGGSCR